MLFDRIYRIKKNKEFTAEIAETRKRELDRIEEDTMVKKGR